MSMSTNTTLTTSVPGTASNYTKEHNTSPGLFTSPSRTSRTSDGRIGTGSGTGAGVGSGTGLGVGTGTGAGVGSGSGTASGDSRAGGGKAGLSTDCNEEKGRKPSAALHCTALHCTALHSSASYCIGFT